MPRERNSGLRIEALRGRRAVRQHLDADARLIHLLQAQRAEVEEALLQRRDAHLRAALLEVTGELLVPVMLFQRDDLHSKIILP